MKGCKICNTPLKEDLFSYVTQESVCTICKLKYIGGLPTTMERINQARERLGLNAGEFLKQDNPKEAARILGRKG